MLDATVKIEQSQIKFLVRIVMAGGEAFDQFAKNYWISLLHDQHAAMGVVADAIRGVAKQPAP
jgi:hypothetical protein